MLFRLQHPSPNFPPFLPPPLSAPRLSSYFSFSLSAPLNLFACLRISPSFLFFSSISAIQLCGFSAAKNSSARIPLIHRCFFFCSRRCCILNCIKLAYFACILQSNPQSLTTQPPPGRQSIQIFETCAWTAPFDSRPIIFGPHVPNHPLSDCRWVPVSSVTVSAQ